MPDDSTRTARDPLAALYGNRRPLGSLTGVGGIPYARRRKTSPPVVVRAATAEERVGQGC
jgi:hypothetical protein